MTYYHKPSGISLKKAEFENLHDFIDNYDIAVFSDFNKSEKLDKKASEELTRINIALGNLNAYFYEIGFRKLNNDNPIVTSKIKEKKLRKIWETGWENVTGSHEGWNGNFLETLHACTKGQQCHNELAKRLRTCLNTFENLNDE